MFQHLAEAELERIRALLSPVSNEKRDSRIHGGIEFLVCCSVFDSCVFLLCLKYRRSIGKVIIRVERKLKK